MKLRVIGAAVLLSTAAATFATAQATDRAPVQVNVPSHGKIAFRIVDPAEKRMESTRTPMARPTETDSGPISRPPERELAQTEALAPAMPAAVAERLEQVANAEPDVVHVAHTSQRLQPSPATQPTPTRAPVTSRLVRRPLVEGADASIQEQRQLAPQIRLVQAEIDSDLLNDLDGMVNDSSDAALLKQAQDLIRDERAKSASERMTPEQIRERMRQDLDDLLPQGSSESSLPDNAIDDDEDFSYLVDPKPKPIYDRRPKRKIPYTMGDILQEEDESDPYCEEMFCERMWACAGGKCMSPMERMRRDMRRNYALFRSPCGTEICRPMEDFKCPPRNNKNQANGYNQGCDTCGTYPGDFHPVDNYPDAPGSLQAIPIQDAPIQLPDTGRPSAMGIPNVLPNLGRNGVGGMFRTQR